jgi:hypothetical protein
VGIAGNSLTPSQVATQSVTDTQTYGAGVGGTDGLQGESDVSPSGTPDAHEFAHTVSSTPGSGIGSIYIDGLLTLTAPSSTPAGLYTATLTFTIT